MTDGIALGIGVVLALAIGADLVLNGGQALMFLARKFLVLVDWATPWN